MATIAVATAAPAARALAKSQSMTLVDWIMAVFHLVESPFSVSVSIVGSPAASLLHDDLFASQAVFAVVNQAAVLVSLLPSAFQLVVSAFAVSKSDLVRHL